MEEEEDQRRYLKEAKHICTDPFKCKSICGKMRCQFFGTKEGCLRQEITGKPCPFGHVTVKKPPTEKDIEKAKIRLKINEIHETVDLLKDRTDECFNPNCRRHMYCVMKNLEKLTNELTNVKIQKEREKQIKKYLQQLEDEDEDEDDDDDDDDEDDEDDEEVEKLLLEIKGNFEVLEPFVIRHTETILRHSASLREFESVQSNKEAMTNIQLFEERVHQFMVEKKWFKREMSIVFGEFFGRVITPIVYPK